MTWLICGIASQNLGQKVGRAQPATKMGTNPKRMGRKLRLIGIQKTQLKMPKIKRNERSEREAKTTDAAQLDELRQMRLLICYLKWVLDFWIWIRCWRVVNI